MSNEQAIAKLSAIYGHVEMVRDGVLEHRTDPDYHTVKWEVIE